MGKRQISEMQTSELVVTLLVSDIAAIPMQDTGQPLVSGMIPIAVLVMCEIVVSFLMVKNAKFRRVVCGSPIVVINDGRVDQKEMRRLRMTTEDLMEELRLKDVFHLEDVAYAIVETNGQMSVIKKPGNEQPTTAMLNITVPDTGIEAVVVSDGVIYDAALELCRKSRDWLDGVLRGKNVKAGEIFIMTVNRKGDFNIIKKDEFK